MEKAERGGKINGWKKVKEWRIMIAIEREWNGVEERKYECKRRNI